MWKLLAICLVGQSDIACLQHLKDNRLNIATFSCRYEAKELLKKETNSFQIWFDKTQRFRTDILREGSVDYIGTNFEEGRYVFFTNIDSPIGVPSVQISNDRESNRFPIIINDPRVFGIKPIQFGLLPSVQFDETLSSIKPGDSCEAVTFRGQPAIRSIRKLPGDHPFEIIRWYLPSCGGEVAKYERIDHTPDDQNSLVYETFPELHKASGIWYPRRTVYIFTAKGKIVNHEEVIVKELEINKPLPPDTFSLRGLPVPIGRTIRGLEGSDSKHNWDGTHPIPHDEYVKNQNAAPPPTPTASTSSFWYWAAIFFGAVAATTLYVYVKQRWFTRGEVS
jgi:hypothetical protein